MIGTKCLVCGSSSIRADRALSGRLVCNSCGTPLGVKSRRKNIINNKNFFYLNKKYLLLICILILTFILVIL